MGSNLIAWVIFGALAGWIASMIVRTNEQQGALGNILVGIVGAVIGGFIVQAVGGSGLNGFNVSSLIIAIFGSVILLAVVKSFSHHY